MFKGSHLQGTSDHHGTLYLDLKCDFTSLNYSGLAEARAE